MYECNFYECMYCMRQTNSMRQDTTSKMGGGLTSQYKHSANFLGDDIIEKQIEPLTG